MRRASSFANSVLASLDRAYAVNAPYSRSSFRRASARSSTALRNDIMIARGAGRAARVPMRARRDNDDPRVGCPAQQRQKEPGEHEVPQVVHGEVRLEAVGGEVEGHAHNSGVCHEHVDGAEPLLNERCKARHRRDRGQVELHHADPHRLAAASQQRRPRLRRGPCQAPPATGRPRRFAPARPCRWIYMPSPPWRRAAPRY